MAVSPEQLSSTLKHLKRGPAPKAPIGSQPISPVGVGVFDFSSVKLKKTGKRESLIEADMADHGKENSPNELNSLLEKRRKMFDGNSTSTKPATLPRVMPKPRRTSSEGDREISPKPRSESFPRSGSTTDSNDNLVKPAGEPTLKPLPTLQSIGNKPPLKPPKPLILTMKIEKKYKNHKVIIAPKVKEVLEENVPNGSFDQVDSIAHNTPEEPEPIEEDFYDDVEALAETVKAELGDAAHNKIPLQTPEEPEPIDEDFYDDVEALAEAVKAELGQNGQPHTAGTTGVGADGLNFESFDGEFGEDFYQPVEGTFAFDQQANGVEGVEIDDEYQMPGDEQPPTSVQPPPPRESKEDVKTKKEREKKEKELQKKKEKDEQKKKRDEERREREDKKKKEEEHRKREKMDKDLKKAHKLKGNEPVLFGTAKEDISGTGKDLPCTKGSSLEVIVKDNCPPGKWLVKDQQGHYGYVPSESLLLEGIPTEGASEDVENLDEDLYECVDTFQSSQPPPPPMSTLPPPMTDDMQEELYDDTLVEDEDLYDDIPGAS